MYVSMYRGGKSVKKKKSDQNTTETPKRVSLYRNTGKNKGGVLGGIGYAAGRAGVDFLRVGEGALDAALVPVDLLHGNVERAKSRFQDSVVDDLREKLDKSYNPGKGMQVVGDITGGLGQSVGYGLISAIPYAGKPMMYSSIVEQSISSAAEKTGKVGLKEIGYGATMGALEGALESKLGAGVNAVKGVGSAILKKTGREVVESAAKTGGETLLKTVLRDAAKSFAGEFAEEAISEAADPLVQRAFGIDKNAKTDLGSILYAGVIGGVSGGILGGGTSVINYKTAVNVGREIQRKGLDTDLIKRAKYTLSGFDIANERAETMKMEKPTGDVKETKEQKKQRVSVNKEAKYISKQSKELAGKIRENVSAYEKLRADPRKANSDAAAAALGELRGNLFMAARGFEVDTVEAFLKETPDTDRQLYVDAINEQLEANGKAERYSLADFDADKDDIRRGYAGKLTLEELMKGAEQRQAAKKETGAAANAVQNVADAVSGAVKSRQANTTGVMATNAMQNAEQAAQAPAADTMTANAVQNVADAVSGAVKGRQANTTGVMATNAVQNAAQAPAATMMAANAQGASRTAGTATAQNVGQAVAQNMAQRADQATRAPAATMMAANAQKAQQTAGTAMARNAANTAGAGGAVNASGVEGALSQLSNVAQGKPAATAQPASGVDGALAQLSNVAQGQNASQNTMAGAVQNTATPAAGGARNRQAVAANRAMVNNVSDNQAQATGGVAKATASPAMRMAGTVNPQTANAAQNTVLASQEAAGEEMDPWAGMSEGTDPRALGARNEAEVALIRAAINWGVPKNSVQDMLTQYRKGTKLSPAEFAEAWSDGAHTYGRFGFDTKGTEKTAFGRMEPEAREAAMKYGRDTAEAETRKRDEAAKAKKKPAAKAEAEGKEKSKKTSGKETEGKVIRGEGLNVQKLSDEQYTAYKASEILSKVLGTDIVIEASMDSVAGRATNGYYSRKTNRLHININAMRNGKSVALYTLGHEVTHYVREWSPAKYKILSDFVMERMSGDAKTLIDEKVSLLRSIEDYKDLTVAELNDLAAEEVVADGMELILTDGKVLSELANTDKSLWNKVKEWITDIISKIKKYYGELSGASKTAQVLRETMDSLDEIERLFTEAVQEAGERTKGAQVGESEGKVVYSANSRYDFTKTFSQQIEDYKNGLFPEKDALLLGATPEIYQKIGFNALPMTINQTHIDYALNGTKDADHHLGEALLKQLPEKIKEPVAVFVSQTHNTTSVVALLKFTVNGKQVVAPITIDGFGRQNGIRIDSNAVTSVFGKSNAISKQLMDAIIDDSNGIFALLYNNKKEAMTLLQGAGLQLPRGLIPRDGFLHSIRENASPVKPKFENVTESQQFKRWFGDWEKHPNEASKVVNADGTPKIVYHQTGADFTVFNTDNPEAGKFDSETPNGIFFKDNDHDIGLTGKKQMAVYLNARKLLHFANRTEANRWYRKNVPGYDSVQAEYDQAMAEFDPRFKEIEREQFDPNTTDERYDELDRMEEALIEELKKIEDSYRSKLRGLLDDYFIGGKSGYDGIELDYDGHRWVDGKRENVHTYIVFNRNQIKSATDNIGTFDGTNPDIRYSLGEAENGDVSENERLKAENKKLEERVQRMRYRQFRKAVESGEMEAKAHKQELSDGATTVLESIGITDGRNHTELTRRMSELYAKMAGEKKISYGEAFDEAAKISDWLLGIQPDIRDVEASERAKEILKTLRGTKIRLTFTQKGEVASQMGESDAYRKAMFGKVTVTNNDGVPLDVQWAEWSDLYPDVFSKDVEEADMPDRLRRIYDMLTMQRDRTESVDQYINRDELTNTIFTQVGQIGWNEIQTEEARPDLSDRDMLIAIAEKMVGSEHEYKIISDYKKQANSIKQKETRLKELNEKQQELQSILFTSEDAKARSDASKELMTIYEETRSVLEEVAKVNKKLASIEGMKTIRDLLKVERMEARETSRAEYKEMQRESAERKEITIRKRQVQRILNNLNTMLYHPTKAKHVPPLMQSLVDYALKRADPKQFGINRDNIRTMAELAADIEKMKRKVALTADEQERLYKMEAKYEALEADTLSVKRQAEALMTAFETWVKETSDAEVVDENMLQGLRDTVKEIDEAPLHQMTLKSLEAVESLYTEIKHQVDHSNNLFATDKKLGVQEMGQEASAEVAKQKDSKLFTPKPGEWTKITRVREFIWENLKPLTAFEVIGSDKLMSLFRNILNGEDVWVTDVLEGKKVLDEAKKKYGYNKWDLTARSDVTTANGSTVSLTLGERMSLYAYMFRDQAEEHLSKGGFKLAPDAKVIRTLKNVKAFEGFLNDQTAYQMRREDIAKMADGLTQEQKDYARDVQKYLTSLGKKGNEVSLKLYGMEIFNETDYFPIKSNGDYLKAQAGKTGDPQIKNRGTFKETTPGANNPIVLEDFMQVTSEHINTMAVYHAFTLPMEDLLRVWNYKPVNYKTDENGNVILDDNGMPKADNEKAVQNNSLKAEITKKYGKKANDYILQLMRDLNGGARQDSATTILDKGLTAFKRSATMLSLSTIIQQPTSIFRAMAYIDPKWFTNVKLYDYETIMKYAPVASIKRIGGHDTSTGARTVEYINSTEYDNQKEKLAAAVKPKLQGGDPQARAEYFGFLTEKADEITWRYMFGACVNEQAAKLKQPADSEAVLKAAGERFADVVRRTQVYDSTLTRNEIMRSKSSAAKMVTAFGAEPATVVSMMVDAFIRAERGDKTFFRKTAGAVALSIIINSMASSLIYAIRDDDEDKNFIEKYIESLTSEIIEGFNILEYLPYARDVMSLFKGYDVERSDMTLIGNLFDQIELITSSNRSVPDKLFGVSGAVASFFGVPITNVYRDVKGIVKTTLSFGDAEPMTGGGTAAAAGEGVRGQFNLLYKILGVQEGNAFELYKAALRGDTAHYERVAARYETASDAEQALRRELRENDKRINQAAQAKLDGDLDVYESIIEKIEGEGHFDRNLIIRAINNEVMSIKDAAKQATATKDEIEEEEEIDEAIYSATDLADALERGDTEDYESIYEYLIAYKTEQGQTEAQARASIKSSMTAKYKKLYLAAWARNDSKEMKRILALLQKTGLYGTGNDTAKTVEKWVRDANK